MAVLFGGADSRETAILSSLVGTLGYAFQCERSYAELDAQLQMNAFAAVIMDIDSFAVDNQSIRHLAFAYPDTPILCISKNRLHPELSDSIQNHIFACLTKPIDQDELGYWLNCIRKDSRRLSCKEKPN